MSNPSAPGMLGNYSHTLSSVGATGGGGGGSLSLGGSMNGMGGGAGSTAANNSQPTAGSSGPPSAMDTINQAYTGIQQYAGLSGLLSQGKSTFHIKSMVFFFLCSVVFLRSFALCSHVSS